MSYITSGVVFGSGLTTATDIDIALDSGAIGAGNRVMTFAIFARDRGQTFDTVRYNGVLCSAEAAITRQGSSICGQQFRIVAPATGSNTLRITPSTASGTYTVDVVFHVEDDVDQADAGTAMTPTVATAAANVVSSMTVASAAGKTAVVLFGMRSGEAGRTCTPSGYTERATEATNDNSLYATCGDAAGAASVVTTGTWNNTASGSTIAFGISLNRATPAVGPLIDPTSGTTNGSAVETTDLTTDQAGRVQVLAYRGATLVGNTTVLFS